MALRNEKRVYFWNSYPFVRLSIVLILGICSFPSIAGLWENFNLLSLTTLGLFAASLLLSRKFGYFKFRVLNGLLVLFIIFLSGGQLVKRQYNALPTNHYSRITSRIDGFAGVISGTATDGKNHHRYNLDLSHALISDSITSATGRIHLYVRKDSSRSQVYHYGDILMVRGSFWNVSGPGNPHEFNYKEYLSLQGISAQAFVRDEDIKISGQKPPSQILQQAFRVRDNAALIIDRNVQAPRENGIAKALVLGIKDDLDNEVRKSYAAAGAMHVLAVSGLHVGIVYLFLKFLFGRLRSTSNGRTIFGIISVLVIWSYATITGLSPSVLRAATMFSIVAVSEIKSRKGNVYNALGLAAFVLLIYDPNLIYAVGFQLSFAAVLGIVYLQPKMYRLLDINTRILDQAWAITCVSIAAQVATFPLTAYYFHQFPTYFLVSNLVVIPAATLMLVVGILLLILDPISTVLGSLVGKLLSGIIWTVNESVSLVEALPHSQLDWIHLDHATMVLTYFTAITLIWGLHRSSFKTLLISFLALISIYTLNAHSTWKQAQDRAIVIYSTNNAIAMDYIEGHKATLYISETYGNSEALQYNIDPFRLASGLPPVSESTKLMSNSPRFRINKPFTFGHLGDQKILIVDSTTFHLQFKEPIQCNIMIVENGSIKNLAWLAEHFQYDHLIIGNRNSRSYVRRMKKQADNLNLEVHALSEEGAFILHVR